MSDYTKLSNLVDDTFTVQKVFGYKFKMWDNTSKKMLISETWVKDYRKMYTLDTDKGTLDLSASQMGNLLESVTKDGRADINGRTFNVKSNGKSGMDMRYFLSATRENVSKPSDYNGDTTSNDTFDLSDIGF